MHHLDLFSGIGGFAYAIDQVWEGVEHTFCEVDPFCRQVLKKHWPQSKIYGDIRLLKDHFQADLITGGFPCQPFSQAGKRGGTNDNRYLWPEMFRVIQEFKPTWVIAENVRGLLTIEGGMVFEQVCLDLEASDYEVQPLIVPAVAVNAPHRRDRVWIVAHSTSKRDRGSTGEERPVQERELEPNQSKGSEVWRKSKGCVGQSADWNKNWLEVATELCSVDDELSVELDGFKLSKAGHRREQLKAYGNAIVPAVAVEILKSISF